MRKFTTSIFSGLRMRRMAGEAGTEAPFDEHRQRRPQQQRPRRRRAKHAAAVRCLWQFLHRYTENFSNAPRTRPRARRRSAHRAVVRAVPIRHRKERQSAARCSPGAQHRPVEIFVRNTRAHVHSKNRPATARGHHRSAAAQPTS
jgi:hypothetical protein